jgi:hypothetical protein
MLRFFATCGVARGTVTRQYALSLVGRRLLFVSRYGDVFGIVFVFTRFDPVARLFSLRNPHTSIVCSLPVTELETGIREGILRLSERTRT